MLGWTIDPAKLRTLREEAQITPTELSALAGCHRGHYYKVENGGQEISAERVWSILNVLSNRLGRKVAVPDIATPRERPTRRKATASVGGDTGGNVAGSAA